MNDIEDAKKAWHEKMYRIESWLDKAAVPDSETETLNAENEASIAKARAQAAETRKIVAVSRETTAKMLDEMKWIPLKTGLWTTAMLLAAILLFAAFPKEASKILRPHRSMPPQNRFFLMRTNEESGLPGRDPSS